MLHFLTNFIPDNQTIRYTQISVKEIQTQKIPLTFNKEKL